MTKTFLAAAMAAYTSAEQPSVKIIYPGEQVDLIQIDPAKYPMVFKWPEQGFRCGATMVSPQMALTAAHCVRANWDSGDPNLTVKLSDGQSYGIKEFRTNECWDFSFGGPYSADIAIMVLDRPIQNAQEFVHYIPTWNAETMDDVVGREFELAGWGASGSVNDEGDWDESHTRSEIFHRGYNVVNAIVNNMLVYTMDRPEDGGLPLESMGHYGDSGSGALLFEPDGTFDSDGFPNGKRWIIGVKSNGGPAQWGTSHQYTRVGGYHWQWVQDNLNSLNERIPADGCDANGGGDDDVYENCEDTNWGADGNLIGDVDGDPCTLYTQNPGWCGGYDTAEFISREMCCVCGGGRELDDNGDDDSGDDGNDGDDGNGGDQSVQDLVDAAAQAAATCSSQADGAQGVWDDLLNNYIALDEAVTKSLDELMKAEDARTATAGQLETAQGLGQTSADVAELLQLKDEATQQQQIAVRAAKEVNKAKQAGVKSANKLVQNANAIATPQASCQAAMQAAEESMMALNSDYPDEVDAIALVQESVSSITSDLAFLNEFGSSAEIKEEANDEKANFNQRQKAANNAKKGANSDKKKITNLYNTANSAAADTDALNLWASQFVIPADEGEACKVRASRGAYTYQDSRGRDKYTHDFIIFYISGDCDDATYEEEVMFQKNSRFWSQVLIYDGDMTDLAEEDSRVRQFNLQQQGADNTDRIAMRIKKQVKKLVPRTPRGVTVSDVEIVL